MKGILGAGILSGIVILGSTTKESVAGEVENQLSNTTSDVSNILDKSFLITQFDIDNSIEKAFENFGDIEFTSKQKSELSEHIYKSIQDKKEDKNFESLSFFDLVQIFLPIILAGLYGYAYYPLVRKVFEGQEVEGKSFFRFSAINTGLAIANGPNLGSLGYLVASILAGTVYLKNIQNKRFWNQEIQNHISKIDNDKIEEYEKILSEKSTKEKYLFLQDIHNGSFLNKDDVYNEFIYENPLPVVRYNAEGKPLIWNKKMQEITGYTYEEVLDYYNEEIEKQDGFGGTFFEKRGEVMSLLYKGDNLKKVEKYVLRAKETGKGYKDIDFTLTTKFGEEKTFLWTTRPDGQGGTIRTGYLVESKDIIEYYNLLTEALEEERVLTYFQPIFDAQTGQIFKYEVLMRVKGKNSEIESPYKYLIAAEKLGKSSIITHYIINKIFPLLINKDVSFSLNLSSQDLEDNSLIAHIDSVLDFGMNPGKITFEVLESEWQKNKESMQNINHLKKIGFKIAIDDFGVNNSNMDRLLQLLKNNQLDYLKIDGAIIRSLYDDDKKFSQISQHFLKGLIESCHIAEVKVIAEYVENEEIYNICRELGIDYLQGFYLSEPMPNIDE